ncbi:MAG: substrate-binding domain-containing protein [Succinivibrionaceae bacterium]|nr:substrate-binding domain-containing protein [Succinivibrionaceae bacterium]
MGVTLKDLARVCGVSVGTVSRALNGKNEVSEKTSDRIRQLAQELGYVPNRAGRALSAQRNLNSVGILLPSINSPFFDDIKRGIMAARAEFMDLGLDVAMSEVEGWDPPTHLMAIEDLRQRGCKAFALCTVNDQRIVGRINELCDAGLPVMLLNNDLPDSRRIFYVGPDYLRSGQIAAAMLDKCNQGRSLRILVVTGLRSHVGHAQRVEGFIGELDRRHADYKVLRLVEGQDSDIITQRNTMAALRELPEINCIYMSSGSGVSGLGAAVIADRSHSRFVVACDEIYTTRELVRNDIIDFVITQEPFQQGYQSIKRLHDYLSKGRRGRAEDFMVDSIIKIKNHFE